MRSDEAQAFAGVGLEVESFNGGEVRLRVGLVLACDGRGEYHVELHAVPFILVCEAVNFSTVKFSVLRLIGYGGDLRIR